MQHDKVAPTKYGGRRRNFLRPSQDGEKFLNGRKCGLEYFAFKKKKKKKKTFALDAGVFQIQAGVLMAIFVAFQRDFYMFSDSPIVSNMVVIIIVLQGDRKKEAVEQKIRLKICSHNCFLSCGSFFV